MFIFSSVESVLTNSATESESRPADINAALGATMVPRVDRSTDSTAACVSCLVAGELEESIARDWRDRFLLCEVADRAVAAMFRVNSNRPASTAVGSKKYHVVRSGTYVCVKLPILFIPARREGSLTWNERYISTVELSIPNYVRAACLPDEGLVAWGGCILAHA